MCLRIYEIDHFFHACFYSLDQLTGFYTMVILAIAVEPLTNYFGLCTYRGYQLHPTMVSCTCILADHGLPKLNHGSWFSISRKPLLNHS